MRNWLALSLVLLCTISHAQSPQVRFVDDLPVNYIYANLLGTGFYDINGRQAAVVRMPLASKPLALTDTAEWRPIFPLLVGYETRSEETEWERWVPTQLLSASLVPGAELFYQPSDSLLLKPYIQAGLGRDYTQHKTTYLALAGVRSLAAAHESEQWQVTLGNALHWAGERGRHQEHYTSFALFETGIDFKRNLPYQLFDRRLNMSFFGVWQHFFMQRNSDQPTQHPVAIDNLLKLGVSLGTRRPYSILGVEFDTVSMGMSIGEDSYGLTFGTGFPF